MSIINRLKSLFKEEKEMIEKDIEEKISKDVTDGSSDLNDTIVSGTKTSVPISDVLKKEDKSTATIELKFKKEVTVTKEESVEETLPIIEEDEPSNEEIPDEAEEVSAEESLDVEENTSSEEEDVNTDGEIESAEKVDDDEKEKEDKKRDNMTLLTDKELLTDANRDPEFTAEFIDAGIETVKHCFQCGTCGGGCPSGRRTPYKVRQIVRKCLLGLKEEVI
ncbi:MAG: CoB--CoM heterodisulfide reductase subunit C, partial [Methanobrevibacter sp.]|nr:CoB--CoM heterodisulfide reductase subunit C [Methanobrevibacter sp.]